MDVELTEDQELFRVTTRKFLEAQCPLPVVRSLEHDPAGFSPAYWRQGAELGWTSMLVPEADGGGSLSGEGLMDLAIVAEELGRLVSPGPLVPTNVVADAIARRGTPEQRRSVLPGIVAGELVAAWAFAEPAAGIDPAALACRAEPAAGRWVLRGRKLPVEAAAQSSHLLVTAVADGGLTQFLIAVDAPGVEVTAMKSLDFVRRYASVDLVDVVVGADDVVGDVGGAASDVERQLHLACVLACAGSAGATDRVLGFTLEYLDDRYSFGRPLSSYQALKHRCADMKMWLEASHAAVSAAARAVQRDLPDAPALVSAAKAYVGTHSTEIIQDCVQLHGGIGVTWEHDIHLYLRRTTVDRGAYGSPAEHRERIAALLGMGARQA